MSDAVELRLGSLIIFGTSLHKHITVRYMPRRGRRVFVCGLMEETRIDYGLGDSHPCIWVGSVAFDITRAEAERVEKMFPRMRLQGVKRSINSGVAS